MAFPVHSPGKALPLAPCDTHLSPLFLCLLEFKLDLLLGHLFFNLSSCLFQSLKTIRVRLTLLYSLYLQISINKSCDTLSNSLFNCAREGPPPCAIVLKKVIRLAPVCRQAFDVVNIWSKVNIRFRSTQAQDPLNCLTCSTKFHLFPTLKTWNFRVFVWHGRQHQRDSLLDLTWIWCSLWPKYEPHQRLADRQVSF